jgi:hypothetical protein
VCVMHPFCSPKILSISSGLSASYLHQINYCICCLISSPCARIPYDAFAEIRSVLVHDSEAALHKLVLEPGIGPIAQFGIYSVAATFKNKTGIRSGVKM